MSAENLDRFLAAANDFDASDLHLWWACHRRFG